MEAPGECMARLWAGAGRYSLAEIGDAMSQSAHCLMPGFQSAYAWRKSFHALVAGSASKRPLAIVLRREDGNVFVHRCWLLPETHPQASLNFKYLERCLKFLLWQKGAARVEIAGAPELMAALKRAYAVGGTREFDAGFMGGTVFERPFELVGIDVSEVPEERDDAVPAGIHEKGCRVGLDVGGSERKAVALVDGRLVFSESLPWSPYFEKDPAYHRRAIEESLERAARVLPRVDAIGVSSAGIHLNNEVRVASLFRGLRHEEFVREIRPFFKQLARVGGPVVVLANDGDVAALAGARALGKNAVLGTSFGTSQAGGLVRRDGCLSTWFNELAFVPVDYDEAAPADEWSGDRGCGVQYFSIQALERLARAALPGLAPEVQGAALKAELDRLVAAEDARAKSVYACIGDCFGHAVLHYAEFYEIDAVLLLGGVTAGLGGELILEQARQTMNILTPDAAARLELKMPSETGDRRYFQAMAAALMPSF